MRLGVLVLGGLLALPAATAAQTPGGFGGEPSPDLVPYTAFAVTPWVGLRLGYGSGSYFVFTEASQLRVTEARGGGAAVGVDMEARVGGPLSVVGGVAYSGADQDEITFEALDGSRSTLSADGPSVLFVKAGLQYRIPDPLPDNRRFHPAAFVTVAPALVVMDWPEYEGFDGDVGGTSTNFALNLGVNAVSRIGTRGLALAIGLEDYVTFWNQDRARRRDEVLLGAILEEPVTVDYDSRLSNLLMLRLGASWRF